MHNIVIAGAGRTKRSHAVRSLEELVARTTDPLVTIPLHSSKDDDIPEVLAWAYGTAMRLGVKVNVVMLEENYDLAVDRHVVGGEYDFTNRLIKDAHEVTLVDEEAQVFRVAVQDADEAVLAWADEDPISATVLRLAQRRHLPVTDLTASLDSSAGETDEDDDEYGAEEGAGLLWVPDSESAPGCAGDTDAHADLPIGSRIAMPSWAPSDPLREAIDTLVDAVVAEVVKGVTAALQQQRG